MINRSLRAVNLWRKPHSDLGEYEQEDLKKLFKCKPYAGWPSCDEGGGKQMIRVGAINSLGTHRHTEKQNDTQVYKVDMKWIRLNHYIMRTKEDAERSSIKWSKLGKRLGQIATNSWFKIIFDVTILDSKRLL